MKTILVVDDERSIQESLTMILEYEKYSVDCALSGPDALDKVQSNGYAAVLLDVKMPGMDGLEVLDKIRQINPDLPVVMISGHGTIETAVEATKRGAFDFLQKPLDRDKVLVTIRNCIERTSLVKDYKQIKETLEGQNVIPHVYPHQIAFNLLPEIDVFLDSGYSKEEQKMVEETRKIMHAESIAVSATCVRVPVFIGHSEAINVEFTNPISPEEARRILAEAPGVRVLDDPNVSLYPQPWLAAGSDDVYVGRIRTDISHPNSLVLWVVSDNLRKGAALNAVQIAEEAVKREWVKAQS